MQPCIPPLFTLYIFTLCFLSYLTCKHFNIQTTFLSSLNGERITAIPMVFAEIYLSCFCFVGLDGWGPWGHSFGWQAASPTSSSSGCKIPAAWSSWGLGTWGTCQWPQQAGEAAAAAPANSICPQAVASR